MVFKKHPTLSGDFVMTLKVILYECAILPCMAKQPLNDDQRQDFLDNLPEDQKNTNAEQTFNEAIERAAQPKQSEPEKSTEADDGYSDTQTHSDTAEDTSR